MITGAAEVAALPFLLQGGMGGGDGIQNKGFEGSLTLRNVDVSENAGRGLNAKEIGSLTISGALKLTHVASKNNGAADVLP